MKENFDDLVYTKNEFGETWKKVTDKDLIEKVKSCFEGFEKNRFRADSFSEVIKDEMGKTIPNEYQDTHYIIEISAGKNGPGDWIEYLADMISIFNNLKKYFNKVYLIDWKNDCADDVSYARVAVGNEIND